MGTISVPSRTLCPTVEVANGKFFCFLTEETGTKELLWKQHSGSHFVSFLMHICGAKFQILQGLESLASGISTRLLNGPVTSSDCQL